MDVGHEGGADAADAEAEGYRGDVPAWADVFAGHVGGDLEEDVRDVEDGEDFVVVVAREAEVGFEAGEFGVACFLHHQYQIGFLLLGCVCGWRLFL